jgi:hypothetical protein
MLLLAQVQIVEIANKMGLQKKNNHKHERKTMHVPFLNLICALLEFWRAKN